MSGKDENNANGESKSEEVTDIRNQEVVTKYMKAADVANDALELAVKMINDGERRIARICGACDDYVNEQVAGVWKKKQYQKGLAFPTCVSVNEVAGHYAALAGDETKFSDGDLVKVDLGVHIDGYVAAVATTVVAGKGQEEEKARGNLLGAVYTAAECALRLCRPGNANHQITSMIGEVAELFEVTPLQGILSHEMDRFDIDGEKVIISKETPEQKVDEFEFEPNQVYAIDIVMSTGDGTPVERDERETKVYKRNTEQLYNLKMKTSKEVFSAIKKNFPVFPFSRQALEGVVDAKKISFGIRECCQHELVYPYPVLYEKDGEFVAQVKFTVLITENGTKRITGPKQFQKYQTEVELSKNIKEIMNRGLGGKKKKKKKKKGKK